MGYGYFTKYHLWDKIKITHSSDTDDYLYTQKMSPITILTLRYVSDQSRLVDTVKWLLRHLILINKLHSHGQQANG